MNLPAIADFIDQNFVYLLCMVVPGLLFILGGLRHWRRQAVTLTGVIKGSFTYRQPRTLYGNDARDIARMEMVLGGLALLVGVLITSIPAINRLLSADTPNPLHRLPLERLRILYALICGTAPGVALAWLGLWVRINQAGLGLRFQGANPRGWFRRLVGEPALAQARALLVVGGVVIVLSFLFMI